MQKPGMFIPEAIDLTTIPRTFNPWGYRNRIEGCLNNHIRGDEGQVAEIMREACRTDEEINEVLEVNAKIIPHINDGTNPGNTAFISKFRIADDVIVTLGTTFWDVGASTTYIYVQKVDR